MRYTVITDSEYDPFLAAVNERLGEGWKLQGGVSVTWEYDDLSLENDFIYAQAMTFEDSDY